MFFNLWNKFWTNQIILVYFFVGIEAFLLNTVIVIVNSFSQCENISPRGRKNTRLDGQVVRRADARVNGGAHGWTSEGTDGWKDGWADGRTDGIRPDRRTS